MRLPPLSQACLAAVLTTAACGAEANYTLQLRPVVPLNQEPFREEPVVWVGIDDPDAETEWTELDALSAGTTRATGFGPLAGDRVAVALGGSTSPADDPSTVTAFGSSSPLSLSTGGDELDLGVLIADTDGVGSLSTLDQPAYGAALAVLDDGRAYAFGGIRVGGGACEPTIRRLPGLNEGDWVLDELSAELPEGVCYAVATVVELDGRQQIVLTGGETAYNGYNQRSNKAVLFDPATDSIIDTADGIYTRARHTVAPLPDGRLLLVGAHQLGSVPPSTGTWEVLDPDGLEFGAYGTVDIAPWEFMAAPVPGGVAMCGGGQWVRSTITPQSACYILRGDGTTEPLPPLPFRVRAGGMARLSDGRLLVAGGITVEGGAGTNLAGIDSAFLLDPNADTPAWQPLPSMTETRAYPAVVADNRGGAFVLGGAEAAWGFGGTPGSTPGCGERLVFDGGDARFEALASCGEAGSGVMPSVATHPSFGAVLLEGRAADGTGGTAVGTVSRGPGR